MAAYILVSWWAVKAAGLPGELPLPVWAAWVLGLPLLLAGGFLILAGLFRLGFQRAAGVEYFPGAEGVQLETSGLFAYTRNPMYLAGIFIFAALALLLRWTPMIPATVLVYLHVLAVGKWEERELAARYGEAYLAYRRRVPFLWPWLRR